MCMEHSACEASLRIGRMGVCGSCGYWVQWLYTASEQAFTCDLVLHGAMQYILATCNSPAECSDVRTVFVRAHLCRKSTAVAL